MPLLAAHLHRPERARARRASGARSSRGSMRATAPPRWARTVAPVSLDREHVVGHESRPAGHDAAGQRRLAGARAAEEGDRPGRRARPRWRGTPPCLAAPRPAAGPGRGRGAPSATRPGRRRARRRVRPSGGDEVAPVPWRPHAEADVVVGLHGEPDPAVDEPALEQRARAGPGASGGRRRRAGRARAACPAGARQRAPRRRSRARACRPGRARRPAPDHESPSGGWGGLGGEGRATWPLPTARR